MPRTPNGIEPEDITCPEGICDGSGWVEEEDVLGKCPCNVEDEYEPERDY